MAHETPKLDAKVRSNVGTKYARRLRRAGQLPAVIYGHKQTPLHVTVDPKRFLAHLHHGAHLVEVKIDNGSTENCLIKDIQFDYLGSDIIHVDLTRVDLTEEVEVEVALVFKGQDDCPGLKSAGAYLEHDMNDLSIKCVVTAIPDSIVVDLSKLGVNGVLYASEIELPAGVVLNVDPQTPVASIHVAKEEEAAAEGEAVAAPEVITERKADEK